MPKAEKGTPKDIANRIKAKGLQKLKWYCQMCQKQCRDENGFKCHSGSDSHLRQMKLFSSNSSGLLDDFSKDFERLYMETLQRRHGTSRVNANAIYQEVIQDRDHIHMNATKWTTLSDFVQHLGKTAKCSVEETERGWYVTYIERDVSILARRELQERKVDADRREEERMQKRMEIQRVEAVKAYERATNGGDIDAQASNMEDRGKDGHPIKIIMNGTTATSTTTSTGISGGSGTKKRGTLPKKSVFLVDDDDDNDNAKLMEEEAKLEGTKRKSRWGHKDVDTVPHSKQQLPFTSNGAIDRKRFIRDNNADHNGEDNYTANNKRKEPKRPRRESANINDDNDNNHCDNVRKDYWLYRDILVRIISKKLQEGTYYKRKAVVDKVLANDRYTAKVEVLDSSPEKRDGGAIIQIDQEDLETIVPKEGKLVRILNGPGRHKKATVVSLNKKTYLATLELLKCGRVLKGVDYGDFSKLA